jgi:hypothetical protein
MNRIVSIAAAVTVLVVTACGDDSSGGAPIDAPVAIDAGSDAAIDGPVATATLTTFVIDQVLNNTDDTAAPAPFSAFENLPDPDGDNAAAYDSLFR